MEPAVAVTDSGHTENTSGFQPQSPMLMCSSRSFAAASAPTASAVPAPSTPTATFPSILLLPRKPPRRRRRSSLSPSSSLGGATAVPPHRARAGAALGRSCASSLRRYRTRARERRCAVLATAYVSSDAAAAASVVRATVGADLSDDEEDTNDTSGIVRGFRGRRVSISGVFSEADLFETMSLNDDDATRDCRLTLASTDSMPLGTLAPVTEGLSPPSIRRVSAD
mmetsp:Transcript_48482/g.89919  ORF Transcript_48482/g.89919 Transcript_48482/m.89919 type:complete len:225 (+) Transcript_48482:225-899(+)